MGVPQALSIAAQVAEGLAYAHQQGVVHRDIKPANIMVVAEGPVKITDFGIARMRASADLTQTGVMLGSPKYMSPEQVIGKRADHRSDIFSLGVILYEMLTGAAPFSGENVTALMYQIVNFAPPAPSSVNPQVPEMLDFVVAKMLVKPLDERYQDAREVARDLRECERSLAAPVAATLRGRPSAWRAAAAGDDEHARQDRGARAVGQPHAPAGRKTPAKRARRPRTACRIRSTRTRPRSGLPRSPARRRFRRPPTQAHRRRAARAARGAGRRPRLAAPRRRPIRLAGLHSSREFVVRAGATDAAADRIARRRGLAGSRSRCWPDSRRQRLLRPPRWLFPLGAVVGLALAGSALRRSGCPPRTMALPLGLPDLPFHLRLDPLAGFFLLLLGGVARRNLGLRGRLFPQRDSRAACGSSACSTTCSSPRMAFVHPRRRRLPLHGGVGDDGALLVLPGHHRPPRPAIRSAGFLYLLIAHLGAHRDPAVLRRAARRPRRLQLRCAARRRAQPVLGDAWRSCWPSSASAPRPE